MTTVALTYGLSRPGTIAGALDAVEQEVGQAIRARSCCRVLIKPNMVSTSRPLAATHVDALEAVLDRLQRYQDNIGKIIIGEGPAGSPAQEGFTNYGYLKLAEEYSVEFMDLNRDSCIKARVLQIEGGEAEVRIAETAVESDYKISLTVPKTHETAMYTGATKNFIMGSVIWDETDDKIKVHGFNERRKWDKYYTRAVKMIHKNIARLFRILRPDLSVIDGFVAMEGNGPVMGTPLNLGVAVVGRDPVATDAVAASVMGFSPLDIGYLYYIDKEGLGTAQLSRIEVVGSKISDVRKKCRPHRDYAIQSDWRL